MLSDSPFPVDWSTGLRQQEKGAPVERDEPRGSGFLCFSSVKKPKRKMMPKVKKVPAIILHFHGGGFVAMSSSSHQNYTRKWAKITGCPIFSVDYRLSPEYAFPDALNDCWQVYYWLVNHAED